VFDDTRTVPNAGLVIPLRLADQLGLAAGMDRRVAGTDRGGRPNSGAKVMNLVAMLIAGGEFLSDVGILAASSTMQRLGYGRFSESRLGEWLRSLDAGDIEGLGEVLSEVTAGAWTRGLGPELSEVTETEPVILDLDSTHTQTYGTAKEGAGARNYLGKRGYHPLLAVEESTGQVIGARLRGGNASPAQGVAGFVAESLQRLRELTGPTKGLLIRADSGFYLRELFDHCAAADARFSVTVRQYRPIREQIAAIDPDHWKPLTRTPTRQIDIAAVPFLIKGRAGPRPPINCRLIIRRVTTPADTGQPQPRLFDLVDYHAFVTDQPGDPETLWLRHRRRARIETTIRDLKYGLGLNHFPSGSYTANAAWLQLNSLAHNLCRYTNQLITTRHLTTKTLRYRYLTLPGRITTGSRTTTLHLPAQWRWQHHITHALTAISSLQAA
jgi:hypothetical protein